MEKKPFRWFIFLSLSLAAASFVIAILLIVPLYTEFLVSDYDQFAKRAEPLGIVLSSAWLVTVVWGLFVHGRRGVYLLIGAPLALLLPAFVAVLGYSCSKGACF